MAHPPLMTPEELVALPAVAATHVYGAGEARCELFLPPQRVGPAPLPIVIAIHGGCWRAMYDMDHLSPLCGALAQAGFAVWSLEYRRVGNGGGWPNTFLDVGAGADRVREAAAVHNLDLNRVVALGHSAGGHLALWLGARQQFGPGHALHQPNPLRLRGILGLAAIVDLADTFALGICSGNAEPLLGGMPHAVPERYAAASPSQLLPLGTPVSLLCGEHDDEVYVAHTEVFYRRAQAYGDTLRWQVIDAIGHFELVAPGSRAWPHVLAAVQALAAA
jgi:acetyl esterase/lipase